MVDAPSCCRVLSSFPNLVDWPSCSEQTVHSLTYCTAPSLCPPSPNLFDEDDTSLILRFISAEKGPRTEGWMDPRADLYAVGKKIICATTWNRISVAHPVANNFIDFPVPPYTQTVSMTNNLTWHHTFHCFLITVKWNNLKSETAASINMTDCLLGCCTVWSGRILPTFQRCLLPPLSSVVFNLEGYWRWYITVSIDSFLDFVHRPIFYK
jgi:hypothetical protein